MVRMRLSGHGYCTSVGESFAESVQQSEAEQYLRKAEADNFSRSLCTHATCTIGFDMWREELGGEMPPRLHGAVWKPMIIGSAQQSCDPGLNGLRQRSIFQDVPVYVEVCIIRTGPECDHREQEEIYVKYAQSSWS